jgi:Ca2+-binding RTX toxin-like protein
MSIQPSDLVSLSELLLVACDQSYAGDLLVVDESHLSPYFDPPLYETYQPPYASDFPQYIVRDRFDNQATGFKCVMYQNLETHELVVAMAGTDGTDIKDWWANVTHYGWNQWKQDRVAVFGALDRLIERTQGPNGEQPRIYFTGQSLGGALAQYAAYEFAETHEFYPNTELALVTFNALGGVAALRDEIPNRGSLLDLGYPGFQDSAFVPTRVSNFALVAHYSNENDLVSRAGDGHLGGTVLEFPALDFSHLDQVTEQPYRLDTISAHKIETGYYYPLTEYAKSDTEAFEAAAVSGPLSPSTLSYYYLHLGSLQKVASVMGNLFREDETSSAGAFVQLLFGGLSGIVLADPGEVNALVDAYVNSRYYAGLYENNEDEYAVARDTDWSFRLRVGAAAMGIGAAAPGPFGLVMGLAGAIALAPVFKLVESISNDEGEFLLRTKFDLTRTGDPLPDASDEEVLQRSDMVGAALNVPDPKDSGSRLAAVAALAHDDVDHFAQALVGDASDWYTQTSEYLVERANELGEQSILGTAQSEFWTYSRRAAETNPILLASVYDQATRFASDWSTALADSSSDAAVAKNSPLDVTGLGAYAEKRRFWDGALAGLESLLDLFVGTAHAAAYQDLVSREIDAAVAGIQSVVIRQGRAANPFTFPDFDPDASPASVGALTEGSVRTFTLYLPYDAGAGGQRVELTLAGGAADKLTLLDHAEEVALGLDGLFTLVVPEGRRELSFGLWAKEDVEAGAALALSAQLVDGEDEPTHLPHIELNLALDGVDETPPAATREIRGDWAPMPYIDATTGDTYYKTDDLFNIERLPGVPSTGNVETDQWLDGSPGGDYMVTGDFDQQARGGAGDDTIVGSDNSGNILIGGAGADRIEGGGWADHAAEYWEREYLGRPMGLGDDKIYGGAGDDQIWGESQATQAALNDAGVAPTGITGDWLTGGSGADRIYGSAGNDVLLGGIGEDTLVGGPGMDVLLGDDDFQIRPEGNYWRVVHPNFGDATPGFGGFELGLFPVVNSTSIAPDLIWAATGDPDFTYYKNGGGADVLIGGAGRDILIGQAGDDTLYGGDDDDILAGWEGDDELLGGAGDDLIAGDFGRYEQVNQRTVPGTLLVQAGVMGAAAAYGSAVDLTGDDLLDGGAGDDVLYGEGGDDCVLGGDGDDTLYGDATYLPEDLHGEDILDGGDGDDYLDGGARDDTLYGAAGDDELYGDDGDDTLYGGAGEDIIDGGDGDDLIDGGEGFDVLRGGAGDDTYVLGFGDGRDIIEDAEGANRIRFVSGILAEDVRAELDGVTLIATLTYTGIGDAVSIDLNDFSLGGIDFADGGSWTQKQFVDVLPALVTRGSSGGETLEGRPELKNELRGRAGDDTLVGGGYDDLLDGGDGADTADGLGGSDIYYFSGTETGFDRIDDSGVDTVSYLDWYYAALGITDWRARAAHGGEYRVEQHAEGWTFDVYYGSYEEALAENPNAAIDFLEPLPSLAPVVRRDDAAALDELVAAGVMSRDVVRFGPGVALDDLALRVTVPGASAEANPDAPWRDGGALSVRWADGGFEVAVPGVRYGFAGSSLPAEPESYLLGEGIEAFEFDDGSRYTLEEVLAQATVLPLAGEYHIGRNSGPHLIAANYEAIVFDDFIRASEVQIAREGTDLLLTLGDGTEGRIVGWYGAGGVTPPTALRFYFDAAIDAAALTATGLELHGTEGDDALLGLDGYRDALYGEGGDDLLAGGSGDDSFQGGDGADVYLLEANGGHDVVENPYFWAWPSSADRIRVADGLGPDDILVSHGYSDVSVWLRGSATRIEVQDWLYGDDWRLAGMEFADGTFWDADAMEARFEPAPGTPGDDTIFGTDADDVVFALEGDDEIDAGGGHDFFDAGPGDDYVYEEGGALVIGGEGDDWIDHYGDGGVIAFNPGDGNDTVYVAGATTLSIGGGVRPGDLALRRDGGDLLLDVGGAGAIRLTRQWEDDPAAWPEITLQLFGSVHLYDFNAAIDALVAQADGDPAFALPLGEVLAANELSFSETDGLGGAIAWRYAATGSSAGLSSEQLHDVLGDPGFGASPQPILPEQPNRPPQVVAPIADQAVLENSPFALSVDAAFADPDAGDALAYAATLADGSALPDWLMFDPESASFSGTPGFADAGGYALRVTATDNSGASAAADFAIEVAESAPPCDPGELGHDARHDERHHHHDREKEHARYDYHDRGRDHVSERLGRLPHFDFEELVRELERDAPHNAPSAADIGRGWERVARYAATLCAGGDDWEHGAAWHGTGDLLRLAPGGGHGFGFEGSIGASRGHDDFKSFEGLREGFRRL